MAGVLLLFYTSRPEKSTCSLHLKPSPPALCSILNEDRLAKMATCIMLFLIRSGTRSSSQIVIDNCQLIVENSTYNGSQAEHVQRHPRTLNRYFALNVSAPSLPPTRVANYSFLFGGLWCHRSVPLREQTIRMASRPLRGGIVRQPGTPQERREGRVFFFCQAMLSQNVADRA